MSKNTFTKLRQFGHLIKRSNLNRQKPLNMRPDVVAAPTLKNCTTTLNGVASFSSSTENPQEQLSSAMVPFCSTKIGLIVSFLQPNVNQIKKRNDTNTWQNKIISKKKIIETFYRDMKTLVFVISVALAVSRQLSKFSQTKL